MKKKLLPLAFIGALVSHVSIGQSIPNYGFENWTDKGTYEEPDGWITFNAFSPLGMPVTVSKISAPDQYAGDFSALLETKSFTDPFSSTTDTSRGIMYLGTGNIIQPVLGTPFTGKPSKFSVYYKYQPQGNDNAYMFFYLSVWDTAAKQQVGLGAVEHYVTTTVNNWTKLELTVDYDPGALLISPDTLVIAFVSSESQEQDTLSGEYKGIPGSKLYIDEITFPGSTGLENFLSSGTNAKLYPNPASNEVNVRFADDKVKFVEVRDLSGRLIETYNVSNLFLQFDTDSYNNGIYLYSTLDNNKEVVERGKFVVSK